MTRRRKPPRGLSRTTLRRLAAQIAAGRSLQDVPPARSGRAVPRRSDNRKLTLSEQWADRLRDLFDAVPFPARDETWLELADCNAKRVYADGEIQGSCQLGEDSFEVFANASGGEPQMGCSCDVSGGTAPCRHVYSFLNHLIYELDEYGFSRLRTLIDEQRFTGGKPDRSLYTYDRELKAISALDAVASVSAEDVTDEELPPIRPQAEERIAWNFRFLAGSVAVHPKLQRPYKRGGGFAKGRKINLDEVRTCEARMSDADRRICESIAVEPSRYGYGISHSLSPIAALKHLIGRDNVLLNDEPCTVHHQDLAVRLQYVDGRGWHFRFFTGTGQQIVSCHAAAEGFIWTNFETSQIYFADPLECGTPTLQRVLAMPPVGRKHEEVLFEKARSLQKRLPLVLPPEVGGPLREETARDVVLVRSREDGAIDFGLRIRDAAGCIRRPGSGVPIRSGEADGKPVQWQRRFRDELARAHSLAGDLGISSDAEKQWDGTIQDFEAGLHLIERLADLESQGEVEVLWSKDTQRPVTVLGQVAAKNVRVDIKAKRNWFGISGECSLGGRTVPLDQLLDRLPAGDGADLHGDFVRVGDGQWARISQDLRKRLTRLRDVTNRDRKAMTVDATAAPAIRDLMTGEIEFNASKNWHQCLARLNRAEKLDPRLPAGLRAELRDYQVEGFKWLRRLAEWGVGGVLADDMGLGKTLQMLAVLLDRADEGPSLVIAPTSVGFNWVREAERFTPDLKVHLYRETERADFLSDVSAGDLVICSYGLALRDQDALADVNWGTLVMDEAQAVKNSRSKTAQAIAGINAQWTVALTGTPVENHLGELWSLFHLVSPGVFGGWDQFRRRYALPIEKHADIDARASLAGRLQPFVLRRTKSEVLSELPPRTEMNLYVDLSREERAQYERVRLSALGEIDQIAALPSVADQRFKLLALLTRLRQFACHPGMVNKQWTGSSAKLEQLCETLTELKEEGHRALVFSQFTRHLALIRPALEERGISFQYLDGSTPPAARQQAVDAFQNGEGDCFLISLKAGGTGLNLTAADYVIHMDPWWNPAVEDQATDRAHRIGQENPVMVYRIIAKETIEEEILALHDSKRDLVAGVLEGTGAAAAMSTAELIAMLRSQG